MTPNELADELDCTNVTVLRYLYDIRHRPARREPVHVTRTEQRVIRAWHCLAQTHRDTDSNRDRQVAIRRLRELALDAIQSDPTGASWLLVDLDGARTTHAPLTIAATYRNPHRHPTRALWLIPLEP